MDLISRVFELATLMVGVAILTLLIGNAGKTATVIDVSTSGFDRLLRTLTLSGGNTY